MVQLTLVGGEECLTLAEALSAEARRWSALLGEGDHLSAAVRATRRRFQEWGTRPLSGRECQRLAAYFGAVIRKATMRTRRPAGAYARRRLVAATIEADLRSAGWSAERASAEAFRVTGEGRGAEGAA